MGFFALIYYVVDNFIEGRAPYRDQHLKLAMESHRRGELLLGGAMSEPVDRALLIFRVSERSVVEDFVQKDPYVANGLVTRWEIRPWTVVIGSE